jgi:hypothetical protein
MKKKKEKKNEPCSRTKKTCQTEKKRDNNGQSREEYHIEKEPKKRSEGNLCCFLYKQGKNKK